MSQDLPSLPVGVQDFERLRNYDSVYVDKTMLFPDLGKEAQFLFCARPRRFGKSLTVDALDAFYSGKIELFHGLAAEKTMSSPAFVSRPVVRLDMGPVADSDSKKLLNDRIMDGLKENAERHNVSLQDDDCARAFFLLVRDIHKSSGNKVVILIDEYDAPVINLIGRDEDTFQPELLADTRFVMTKFYSQIKYLSNDIEFCFITGILKFSRTGILSKLNNLADISLTEKYSTFMGYNHEELKTNFATFITASALMLETSDEDLLGKIRYFYEGFSFDGAHKLYNPFSILSFFRTSKFGNFWMESGSNTLVRKFFRDKALAADQFQGMEVNYSFASAPGEIDATSPAGFLYQAGYLTLRLKRGELYSLDYPNAEVREAISTMFMENLNSNWNDIGKSGRDLGKHMASGDVPGMISVFIRLLAGICYFDHVDANSGPLAKALKKIFSKASAAIRIGSPEQMQSAELSEKLEMANGECYYRSLLQTCLWMAGAAVTPEKPENLGRLDLEASCGGLTYVIELKITKNAKGASKAARAGMEQIRQRGYGLASKTPILVSIAVGREERNIVGCLFERDGRETEVRIDAGGRSLLRFSRRPV
jgi:hypothetical protein